ncbi:MAG: SGNH/GDSL hydrolase family protein [Phycisphaeraceae bacterium]
MPELPELTRTDVLDPSLGELDAETGLRWYDLRHLTIEGRGWPESELPHPYARLPARAQQDVREPVWDLSLRSAGIRARFVTEATRIAARWTLRSPAMEMRHMPASGASGLDLYVRSDDDPTWRFAGVGIPSNDGENEAQLIPQMVEQPREFLLHLPLYNGVDHVAIGVPDTASLAPAPPQAEKPIVCYGTSIVHGGCAARTGMAYPSILARKLGRETINLGFSGNGQAEPEVAALLAELDPAVYMLDPLPNLQPSLVTERIEPFVRTLRAARPETPIVLVENVVYTNAHIEPMRRDRYRNSNMALRAAYDRLREAGVKHLHYVPCAPLLGEDNEATVDGTHPTDLGFMRMAEAFEPVLRAVL